MSKWFQMRTFNFGPKRQQTEAAFYVIEGCNCIMSLHVEVNRYLIHAVCVWIDVGI